MATNEPTLQLTLTEDFTREQWREFGRNIAMAESRLNWMIGDWLIAGENKWGEMYDEAQELTGKSYGHLRDCKWIASTFSLSDRSDKLSWTHHLTIAKLGGDNKQAYLALAADNSLSVRKIKEVMTTPPPPPADEVITAWLADHPEENPEYVLNHILQYARKFDPDQLYDYSQLSKAAAALLDMPDVLSAVSVIHDMPKAKPQKYYDPPDWFEDWDGLICECGGDRKVVGLGFPPPPEKRWCKTSCVECGGQLTWYQPDEIIMRDEPPTENPSWSTDSPPTANPYRDNVDRSGLLLPPRDESEPFEHHPAITNLFTQLQDMDFKDRQDIKFKLRHVGIDSSKRAVYDALALVVDSWKAIIRYYDTLA